MRILIITDRYLPDVSGTSLRMSYLVRPLIQTGNCDLHIATLKSYLVPDDVAKNGVPGYEHLDRVHVHRFSNEFQMVNRLAILHKNFQFDLVHARGVRYAFYIRILSPFFRCPLVLELNSVNPQRGLFKSFLWRYALSSSDRLIVLAKYAREWVKHQYKIPVSKIDVVVNGVDAARFNLDECNKIERASLRLSNNLVVGYVGTFLEWQGVLDFVRVAVLVARKHPDIRFLMVGDGVDFVKTKQLAHNLGIVDKFIFTGVVAPQEVPSYMKLIDIFVLPRPGKFLKNQIATPLKLFEAMAMKRAIVVTPVHGLCEVVADRKTGIVAGPSIENIASSVVELVDNNDLRAQLGKAASQVVKNKYSWKVASRNLLDSYQKALAKV